MTTSFAIADPTLTAPRSEEQIVSAAYNAYVLAFARTDPEDPEGVERAEKVGLDLIEQMTGVREGTAADSYMELCAIACDERLARGMKR